MQVRSFVAAFAAVVCCAAAAQAANPMYDSWASHKPGTMVTMAGTSEAGGMKTDMEQTYTLVEVTPEKAVVELKNTMTVMGNKTELPAQKMDIPAGAPATPGETPGAAPAATPTPDAKTSEETVTVAGKAYKATCTETNADQNGMKIVSKVWTSPEVPGNMLKMESTTEGAMKSSTKLEVKKVEIK